MRFAFSARTGQSIMPSTSLHFATAIALAFVLALALTPVVRALAHRFGFVARPKVDRWHSKPTAMMGGVAIFLAVSLSHLLMAPVTPYGSMVITASAFLFLVGFVDDVLHIKPYQKLIGQVMGAALMIYYGPSLPWTDSQIVNMVITIFWLVGITNAVNLLDNMDGLAAGIAAIAAFFLALNFSANGQSGEALMLGLFTAALVGFLVYNSNPASIFMGDSGSMFVGFFLASSALLSASGWRSRSFLPVLAVPVLILFIPIFDTTFVTVLRKLAGRSASQGGRDHTSHRLVALGMSERRAVWMLYGFAGLSGGLALVVREVRFDISIMAILGFTVLLTLVGGYLSGVKVYDEEEVQAARDKPLVAFLVDLSYKRRVFEVMLDVVLITLSYYVAFIAVLGTVAGSNAWTLFLRSLPVLLFVKMATFLVLGVYRGLWRYTSIDDLFVFGKAVLLSTVLSVLAVLFAFRFEGFSRAVFLVDGVVMLMFLAASRMAFRLLRVIFPKPRPKDGRRVLIYGAGDGGELLLRELLNNHELCYAPIGFVDDDPLKKGKVIHGLQVFGGNGALRSICQQNRIEEVVISSSRFSAERIKEITRACEDERIVLRRMRIQLENLSAGETNLDD